MPASRIVALSMLVRIVTPITLGRIDLCKLHSSLALAAARIISSPPSACTSSKRTPGNEIALVTAPLTVFGMSWNFKSRKMSEPKSRSFSTAEGPAAVNKCIFILNMPTTEAKDWESSKARSRDAKSRARINFCRARSIKDVSAPPGARFAPV